MTRKANAEHHRQIGSKGGTAWALRRRPSGGWSNPSRTAKRPAPHQQWATIREASDGRFHICLWGAYRDAADNCDPDERVCRVRVEVLEIREPS